MGSYWNPLDKDAAIVLSNADKTATNSSEASSYVGVRSAKGRSAGRYYAEFLLGTWNDGGNTVGLATAAYNLAIAGLYLGHDLASVGIGDGFTLLNDVAGPDVLDLAGGSVVMVAGHFDSHKVWIGLDGVWKGDPAAGTGAQFSTLSASAWFLAAKPRGPSNDVTVRTKLDEFTYAPPASFSAWDRDPAAISGDLAATEGADVFSAEGAAFTEIFGALTAEEVADTFAAAGQRGHLGSLAATEGADQFSGFGLRGYHGILSAAEAADAFAAAGRIGARGTLAAIELADTFAGLGTVPQHRPKISTGIRDLGIQSDRPRPIVPDQARPEPAGAASRRRNIASGTRRPQVITTRR
jgi:hypothetical protein